MTTESGSQEKLSEICHGDSPQGTSLSENYSKKCNISSPAGIQTTSAGSRSKSTQDEPKQESKLNRTGEDGSSYKQTDTNENLPSRNKDAEAHNTKQETSKEPGPSALQKDTKKDSQEGVEGTSGPVKAEPDFWDLYKTWAEQRCLSKFELLERHVNQLFIRGDNVVSVSIAQWRLILYFSGFLISLISQRGMVCNSNWSRSGKMINLLRKVQNIFPDQMKFHQTLSDDPACFGKTEKYASLEFLFKTFLVKTLTSVTLHTCKLWTMRPVNLKFGTPMKNELYNRTMTKASGQIFW